MKYCTKCGSAILEDSVFCPVCGTPQPAVQPWQTDPQQKKSKKGLLIALGSLVVVAGIGLFLYFCVFTVSMGDVRSKKVTFGNSIYVQKDEENGPLTPHLGQIYVFDGKGNFRWYTDNNGGRYAYEYGVVNGETKIVGVYSYRMVEEGTYTLEDNLLTLDFDKGYSTQYFLEDRGGDLIFHTVLFGQPVDFQEVFRNGEDTHRSLEDNYQKARKLYASGNVQEAQKIFEGLGDYIDSKMWFLICRGIVDEPRH